MTQPMPTRKPTFLWQGVLIVLPVFLLAGLGFLSLRQDRAFARQEAIERAEAIANALAPGVWAELLATNRSAQSARRTFRVDADGRLLFPPPCQATPVHPPLNPAELNADEARLWSSAQQAEVAAKDPDPAIRAYRDLVRLNPPADFAAAARYALGLLLVRQAQPKAAAEMFEAVVKDYPLAVGETGLPLGLLAQFKLFELSGGEGPAAPPPERRPPDRREGEPEELAGPERSVPAPIVSLRLLCSNAVYSPTPLSPQILNRLLGHAGTAKAEEEIRAWQRVWQEHEEARELFAAASGQMPAGYPERGTPAPREDAPDFTQSWGTALRGPDQDAPAARRMTSGAASPALPTNPRLFWFRASPDVTTLLFNRRLSPTPVPLEDGDWLAVGVPDNATGCWYVCCPEAEVGSRLQAIVYATRNIPDYFGVGLELAGKKVTALAPDLRVWEIVHRIGGKGLGQEEKHISDTLATDVLASATPFGAAADLVRIKVYLTSPTQLYARQSTRTFWFGALIAAAAAAAGIGLLAAWRGFQRQQQLVELKSNFVSSVSHELRAPIASVRLMAESLERGKIAEATKQQEYFRFIGQECRRLSALIANVLDFSRIEQGRKQYEFEPTDLVALTQQTVKLMESYAAERQVQLTLALPDLQLSILSSQPVVDGKALQQALINLIDNALKHSPKGQTVSVGLEIDQSPEPTIHSPPPSGASDRSDPSDLSDSIRRIPHPASRITLWVEDHGPGIPAAEHEKIFERFYRRGSELRRETQGVGIGLSIVKHVVEAHGGRVRVRSEVGQGSRFTIELPIVPDEVKSETRNPEVE